MGRRKPLDEQREQPSVAEEFKKMGGSTEFLDYAKSREKEFLVPKFSKSLILKASKSLSGAKQSLKKLLKSGFAGFSNPDASLVAPEAAKTYCYLRHFLAQVNQWRKYEAKSSRSGPHENPRHAYWFPLLIAYTNYLTGSPKWTWIKRWAALKFPEWGEAEWTGRVQGWWLGYIKGLLYNRRKTRGRRERRSSRKPWEVLAIPGGSSFIYVDWLLEKMGRAKTSKTFEDLGGEINKYQSALNKLRLHHRLPVASLDWENPS